MCKVFSSSLGDLGLKWFDKLPAESIGSFYQLTESFVALFVINTKAPKGIKSLLTLKKGKNEMLHNYSKRHWEFYYKIDECSKELAMVSYKLGLTPSKKLWEDLTLNPLDELYELMSKVEMFAWLEDDVKQAERAVGTSSRGNSKFKYRKNVGDYEDRAGHFKEYVGYEKTKAKETEVRPNLSLHELPHWPWGTVSLKVRAGSQELMTEFIVIDIPSPYNAIMVDEEREVLKDVGKAPKAKVMEDLMHYDLHDPNSDCFFLMGSNLTERERTEFIEFLTANIEVFVWTPYEMPEIDLDYIKHELNVIHNMKSTKQ
ncbi:hypothetical protein Acr_10g0005460 [Actinidia rufa]|uniref:Retrotransposon gag domain-containing protein n=1 Tax=Actinidia rufa TaxID=165716 RepID=A0A7J0F933_9ERIC|nr:hypothetical protein Acr_10g0005460 [Actinidia rufa]